MDFDFLTRHHLSCTVDNVIYCDDIINVEDDPHLPSLKPLQTLEEATRWRPEEESCINVARIPFRDSSRPVDKPKTLVCHDMMGGYLEDRLPQGCSSSSCFNFQFWNYVDTFVYFSHNFVTIPPPCWSNAAHAHGVKCLGTLITEWDDGALTCKNFLKDEESYLNLANQMVSFASYYNFDGWLINIENVIEEEQIPHLLDFVRQLTSKMKTALPQSEVLWYDSVTVNGALKWQDELNSMNKVFFDVCDGIFLNYTWDEKKLENSADVGKERLHSVYVGVDVFGRGCYGGGGFSTNEAVSKARKYQLSVAIFAPGWVYECHNIECFESNQRKFWELLLPYLPSHKMNSLPLVTDFCVGQGNNFFIEGIHCMDLKWTNLSCQAYQSCFLEQFDFDAAEDRIGGFVHYETSVGYNGSGCYHVCGTFSSLEGQASMKFKVLSCDIKINTPVYIFYSCQIDESSDPFLHSLCLNFSGYSINVILAPYTESELITHNISAKDFVQPANETEDTTVTNKQQFKILPRIDWINILKRSPLSSKENRWRTFGFLLNDKAFQGQTLDTVSLLVKPEKHVSKEKPMFSLYLGEVKIISNDEYNVSFPQTCNFHCSNMSVAKFNKNCLESVNLTLSWELEGKKHLVKYYDIFQLETSTHNYDVKFIGRSFANSYRLSGVKAKSNNLDFLVQPVSYGHVREEISKCAVVKLSWEH